jgi:hypothetical protein
MVSEKKICRDQTAARYLELRLFKIYATYPTVIQSIHPVYFPKLQITDFKGVRIKKKLMLKRLILIF